MTKDRDFKALVRARMEKTGESYTTARERLLEQRGVAEAAGAAGAAVAAVATAPHASFGCGKCGAPVVDAEDYRRHLEQAHGYEGPPAAAAVPSSDDPNEPWLNQMNRFLYGVDAADRVMAARSQLSSHLEDRYGISVKALVRLDGDVYRVDRRDGPSWVARLFPSARSLEHVNGDAAVLRFLSSAGYPAERCAHDEPVSSLDGHAVLVTEHVSAGAAPHGAEAVRELGGLLGRLHTLAGVPSSVGRPAGALHHWCPAGGSPRESLGVAMSWLEDAATSFPSADTSLYDALRARVAEADDCTDLPQALIHPDFQPANAVASPSGQVLVDWSGAGRGPRVWSLASLLWLAVSRATLGPDLALVDAAVAGYAPHGRFAPEELDRLAGAMRSMEIVLDCFYFGIGIKALPEIARDWPDKDALAEAIADRARSAFA
jgi:Ser/Thr protein kinase RdoA (MazF antagonist)